MFELTQGNQLIGHGLDHHGVSGGRLDLYKIFVYF